MKKSYFITLVLIFVSLTVSLAQPPDGFRYKIKISDNSGTPLNNQSVDIKITVYDHNNNAVYQEEHNVTTGNFGYAEVIIGEGNALQGDFSTIQWLAPMSFNVQVNYGSGWVDYGTQAFAYVPYSKWSDVATKALQVDFNDLTNVPADIADGDDQGASEINDLKDAATYSQGRSLYLGTDSGISDDNTDNYNTGAGYKSLQHVSSGYYNSAAGAFSLQSTTSGYENTAVGSEALKNNTTGYGNTALGYRALKNNSQGAYNVAAGYQSLASNTTGNHNTAIGVNALSSNTSGSFNVSVGSNALASGTTHHHNIAIGEYAMYNNTTGSFNIAIGKAALYSNTDRSHLIAIGDSALYYNGVGASNSSDATENLAIGHKALLNNRIGSKNVAIGYRAINGTSTGYENVAIGTNAMLSGGGSKNVAIGEDSCLENVGDGNVGIGSSTLPLPRNITNSTFVGDHAGYYTVANSTNTTVIGDNADASGMNLGSNSIYFSASWGLNWIGGQVTWSTYSDARIKKDVKENVPGLDFIMRLRPVTYYVNYDKIKGKSPSEENRQNGTEKTKIRHTGFIAQEVEQAAKEVGYDFSGVYKPEDGKGLYKLSYAQFVVPLVKAKQEQQQIITLLTEKKEKISQTLDKVEKQNRLLEEKIKMLEQLIK